MCQFGTRKLHYPKKKYKKRKGEAVSYSLLITIVGYKPYTNVLFLRYFAHVTFLQYFP